jgi:hypothetical protein
MSDRGDELTDGPDFSGGVPDDLPDPHEEEAFRAEVRALLFDPVPPLTEDERLSMFEHTMTAADGVAGLLPPDGLFDDIPLERFDQLAGIEDPTNDLDDVAFGLDLNPDQVDLTFDPGWHSSVADRSWGDGEGGFDRDDHFGHRGFGFGEGGHDGFGSGG